ncbi:MAG: hypothetical protein KJZ73_03120 [Pseudorhodoplanes sp.]|nr:hypothetical protein [Pseudorhodoplanes sp.]GIK79907.1 MAG: hypothetical protein BroJett024_10120 [Alphaproteobacteria bacterium]
MIPTDQPSASIQMLRVALPSIFIPLPLTEGMSRAAQIGKTELAAGEKEICRHSASRQPQFRPGPDAKPEHDSRAAENAVHEG